MLSAVLGCWWTGKYITILQQLCKYQGSCVKVIFQTKRDTKETFIHFIHVLVVNRSYTELQIPHWRIPGKWKTVPGATKPAIVPDVVKPRYSICPSGFSWKAREGPHPPPWSSWPQKQAWFLLYEQNGKFYLLPWFWMLNLKPGSSQQPGHLPAALEVSESFNPIS